MPILGKRSFSLSMLAQDTVKTEAEIAGKQTQRVSNPKSLLPFLLNPNFLERSFQKIQVHRQPGKPYLTFTSAPGGWEACRQTSPRKEGRNCPQKTARVRLLLREPKERAGTQPWMSDFPWNFWWSQRWKVSLCFVPEQCLVRNLFCWKIAKQLYSEALGWLFCQTQTMSKGLLRKTVAMALKPPLPKQLLQTKQDIVSSLKQHQMPMLSGSWMKPLLAGQLSGPHWRALHWPQIAASTGNALADTTKTNVCV